MNYKNAQLAFRNKTSWSIIGEYWSSSGLFELHDMPKVDCITFDTTKLNSEKLDSVLPWFATEYEKLFSPRGCSNMKRLKKILKKNGAKVIKRKKK